MGGSPAAPPTLDRLEDPRVGRNEPTLLLRLQLDHALVLVAPKQRREDLPLHAEIGMPHVGALRGLGHAQGDAAELRDGYDCVLKPDLPAAPCAVSVRRYSKPQTVAIDRGRSQEPLAGAFGQVVQKYVLDRTLPEGKLLSALCCAKLVEFILYL